MSVLWDLLAGKQESGTSSISGTSQQTTVPLKGEKQLYDMLRRMILGQQAHPPETAIGVPTQQAVSMAQMLTPRIGATASGELGLAGRLAGPSGGTASAPNFLGSSWTPGQDQAGLQTREQLGLPPRDSYFTFKPTEEQVRNIGIPPLRSGAPRGSSEKARKAQRRSDRAG